MVIVHATNIITSTLYTSKDGVKWWVVMSVIAVADFVSRIKVVNEQEKGLVIFFGKILFEIQSGPFFTPWFHRLRKITKNSIQVEFGTVDSSDTTEVERANRSEDSSAWYIMREPIRINWGDIDSYNGTLTEDQRKRFESDPYSKTMTTDPHLFFRIRVSNFRNLVERVGGIEEAIERIKDTCVTVIQEVAGLSFVALARTQVQAVNMILKERVEDLVADPDAINRDQNRILNGIAPLNIRPEDSWGLDIEAVSLKDLGTPKRSNEAVADRAKAIALADGEARAAIRKAEGEKKRLISVAEGESQAKVLNAEAEKLKLEKEGQGRAAAIASVISTSDNPTGNLILKLEALTAAIQAGKSTIISVDSSAMTGILGIAEALKANKGGADTPPESSLTK